MSRIHRSRALFSSQLLDIKRLLCRFEISKSHVDSKISNLNVSNAFRSSKNRVSLYAKTADISDVLILVDVFEKVII